MTRTLPPRGILVSCNCARCTLFASSSPPTITRTSRARSLCPTGNFALSVRTRDAPEFLPLLLICNLYQPVRSSSSYLLFPPASLYLSLPPPYRCACSSSILLLLFIELNQVHVLKHIPRRCCRRCFFTRYSTIRAPTIGCSRSRRSLRAIGPIPGSRYCVVFYSERAAWAPACCYEFISGRLKVLIWMIEAY